MSTKPQLNPLLRLALDVGPLVLFFAANSRFGIYAATGAFMVAIVIALAVSYVLTRHIAIMPLISAGIVLVFGGLTLFLQDDTFIKVKPTIIYLLFGIVLLGGYVMRKPLLAMVFDQMFNLTEEGWHKLTLRWMLFFFASAVLNEIVWRTQTTDTWVSFKLFGMVPLTLIFAALQYKILTQYEAPAKDSSATTDK